MPTYSVRVRQDAYIFHETIVDAADPKAAVEEAKRRWRAGESDQFEEGDAVGFDEIECDPDDDVEQVY